jgi:hypothetical protein
MSILELFCDADDFCLWFARCAPRNALGPVKAKRGPKPSLVMSEIMGIASLRG